MGALPQGDYILFLDGAPFLFEAPGNQDSVGYQEGPLASLPSDAAGPAPPSNHSATGHPTVGGTLEVSRLLTADASGIMDQNGIPAGAFRYQWLRVNGTSDTDIPGATESTYRLAAADRGKAIKVKVSFTDGDGYQESRTSAATGRIAAATNSPATGGPTIKGKPELGETLRADTSGIMDENGIPGDVSYTYQWLRVDGGDETDITGATLSTYQLTEDDPGKSIKVRATFTDLGGFTESPISDATGPVSESTLVTEEGYAPRRLYHIDAPVVVDGELIKRGSVPALDQPAEGAPERPRTKRVRPVRGAEPHPAQRAGLGRMGGRDGARPGGADHREVGQAGGRVDPQLPEPGVPGVPGARPVRRTQPP